MNNIINKEFTIRDLENLSGIKAHTIRIWEKRYNILPPNRSKTNIRYYSHHSLQKLLNVSLLNKNGIKISKIAAMSNKEIFLQARELALEKVTDDDAINALKFATVQFDKELFNSTYSKLLLKKNFREIFKDVFVPFFEIIGVLWQTGTILPAHEHFISNLIIQKIQLNTDKLEVFKDDIETYVLFLPENEVHEIGLMYLNYEMVLRGFKTIYLGQNLPFEDLDFFIKSESKVSFVTSLTLRPSENELLNYLKRIEVLLKDTNHNFLAFGKQTRFVAEYNFTPNINLYSSLFDLIEVI